MSSTVRIDKWLWAARFFKTRSLASAALDNGKVRLSGERIKPAHAARIGDALLVDNGAETWEVLILGLSEQRGSAPVARTLYAETEASIARRAALLEQKKLFPEPGAGIKGRPSKRDRRQLNKASDIS